MSLHNTDIQGNANISRNANVGSHANVNGDVTVRHNLFVKGWVDAPNIKGPLKGLYASEEALKAAYPRPMPGWFALVGDTLPADVWRAEKDGDFGLASSAQCCWRPTGETGGEFNLWLDQLEGDVKELTDDVRDLEELLDHGLILHESIEFGATASEAYMRLSVMKRNGGVLGFAKPIPIVSAERAGMMSAADKKELTEATDAITGINGRLRELEKTTAEVMRMLEGGTIDPESVDFEVSETEARLTFATKYPAFSAEYPGGRTLREERALPNATVKRAGVMTAADKKELTEATAGLTETKAGLSETKESLKTLARRVTALEGTGGTTLPQRPVCCCCAGGATGPGSASVIDVDRGAWKDGESYYAGDVNPATGLRERHHVWYVGCKFRCLTSETESAPLWNSPDWEFVEGDPEPHIVFTGTDDPTIAFGETKEIGCRVFIYNQDATADVADWEIERDTGSATEDTAWGMKEKAKDFDGSIGLTYASDDDDLGYAGRAVFRVKAHLDGGAEASGELEF